MDRDISSKAKTIAVRDAPMNWGAGVLRNRTKHRQASGCEEIRPQVERRNPANAMSDYELLYLKFKRRFSTQQLLRRLPRQKEQIAQIALLDVNGRVLRKLIPQKGVWNRIRVLKKEYRKVLQNKRVHGEPIFRERRE